MAKSVEEQGLRMVHLEREGRQLERGVLNITTLTETWILRDCDAHDDDDQYHGDGDHDCLKRERRQLFILRGKMLIPEKKIL